MVEDFLVQEVKSRERELKTLIWITHSDDQAKRVGTRFINFFGGGCEEDISPV
jgi:ABC-type iron transport system FetAB ATPase subunit